MLESELTDEQRELIAKTEHEVHILPKRPGQKGYTQVHCLEDACIMVRVPSSASVSHRSIAEMSHNSNDTTLQAYAQAHLRSNEFVGFLGTDEEARQSSPDNYTSFDLGIIQKHEDDEYDQQLGDYAAFALDECTHFKDPVTFAKELVDVVVAESEVNAEHESPRQNEDEQVKQGDGSVPHLVSILESFRESLDFSFVETKKIPVSWPSIESFNVEFGAMTIDEYLSNFETEEEWMYVIYYQGVRESQCSELHKYQAIYSLPTWKYPIAQATASIFFTVEVCRAKPPNCLVDVTYRYETFRRVHIPGVSDFQEKWLHNILDSKIKFFQTITY